MAKPKEEVAKAACGTIRPRLSDLARAIILMRGRYIRKNGS